MRKWDPEWYRITMAICTAATLIFGAIIIARNLAELFR